MAKKIIVNVQTGERIETEDAIPAAVEIMEKEKTFDEKVTDVLKSKGLI